MDTSALSVVAHAALDSLLPTGDYSADRFIAAMQQFLERISACAQGSMLSTTTAAYEQEMMTVRPAWIYDGMPYLASIYDSASGRGALGAVLDSRLRRLPVDENEVRELKRRLRECGIDSDSLSAVDASLIMLSLRFATAGDVFLITDESKMHEAITALQTSEFVVVGASTYNTRSITPLMVVQAAKCVHGCCELDSARYHSCVVGFARHIDERRQQGTISPDLTRKRREDIVTLFAAVDSEQRSKAEHNARQREEAAEDKFTQELLEKWNQCEDP